MPAILIGADEAVCSELLLPLVLWLPGYYPKKGVRLHDGDAAERTDVRQVVIAGNDEIGLGFQCAGQYFVVLGIVVDFIHFHRSHGTRSMTSAKACRKRSISCGVAL